MVAGTRTLIQLVLRRDRFKLPVWIVAIVASLVAMVPLLQDVYGDQASLATLYQTFAANPSGLFLTGQMDEPSLGALMTIETLLWWGLLVAFMNTLLIVRHTRHNEEIGAQELILSGQVHRGASLTAALAVAVLANGLIAVGVGAGLSAVDPGWGADKSWLYGISIGIFGLAWAALAALVVQLVESARTANGILAGLIGTAFIVRGVGDFMSKPDAQGLMQPEWISWLSPFGWMQATRALTFPEWWPLLISAGFVAVITPLAFILLARRDVGAGILPARKGQARASAFLRTPLGFTWRLQRNIFFGWFVGTLAMVATIGIIVPEMSNIYENSESMKQLIAGMGGTGAVIPAFLAAMLSIVALMAVAYAMQALGKLRSEETNGYLENVLATRLSRLKWLSLHAFVVLVCGVFLLVLSGLMLAVFVNLVSESKADVWEYALAGLSYAPVLAVFAGAYVLLFGILPQAAGLTVWTYYGFIFFASWLGPIMKLDQWIIDLSIMQHLAAAPAEHIKTEPLVVMFAIAVVAVTVGCAAWRRRNLA